MVVEEAVEEVVILTVVIVTEVVIGTHLPVGIDHAPLPGVITATEMTAGMTVTVEGLPLPPDEMMTVIGVMTGS